MKLNREAKISLTTSFAFHLLMIFAFQGVWISGASSLINDARRLFNVKIVEEKRPVKRFIIAGGGNNAGEVLRFSRPTSNPVIGRGEGMDAIIGKTEKDVLDASPQGLLKKGGIPEHRILDYSPKSASPSAQRKSVNRDVVLQKAPAFFPTSVPPTDEEGVDSEFAKEMPGFTPHSSPGGILGMPFGIAGGSVGNAPRGRGGYGSAEQYLTVDVDTYEDPADHMKYFRISIFAGPHADKMIVLPKEVTFLIDCSLSIQPERIDEFKKGLQLALRSLNPGDTFNIGRFRQATEWLSQVPLQPNAQSIDRAARFVGSIQASDATDVYRAFQGVIKNQPGMQPSYIMLLSDGKPSIGVTDSRDIITKINHSNKGLRPIFCFSGGARVNRYLLDFLSYGNRGWSEYAERTGGLGKALGLFYNKIKDPILLNLRYRFSNLDITEVYPKQLPDFYKGAAFTLYGTYTDEKEFSMQLLGESKNETMEFIFTDSLSDVRRGDKSIAREWAFNKVYYLIGKMAERKDDKDALRQIEELCGKFDIKTPYSYK